MEVTNDGILTVVSELHKLNNPSLKVVKLLGDSKDALFKLLQDKNEPGAMLVTLFGMVILVNPVQFAKVAYVIPIVVNVLFASNVTFVRLVQVLNALLPMLVTVLAISIPFKFLVSVKALSVMLVTV